MTDPERISQRSTGLAAELLRAGAEEQPGDVGVQQTLLALGFSGVVLSTTSAAGAAAVGGAKLTSAATAGAGGVGLTTAGAVKAVSATLIVKWIGIGVVGGISFAGVAAVATRPSAPPSVVSRATAPTSRVNRVAAPSPTQPEARAVVVDPPAPPSAGSAVASSPRGVSAPPPLAAESLLDVGVPLAAEVAYVDRARAQLVAGQATQGLALLERYQHEFREARLLPEVLFLQLEGYERLGRSAEARSAAQRLVDGFPKSPHAGRARKLLGP